MMVAILDLSAAFDAVDMIYYLQFSTNTSTSVSGCWTGSTATYSQDFLKYELAKTAHNPSNYTSVCHRGCVVVPIYVHVIAH